MKKVLKYLLIVISVWGQLSATELRPVVLDIGHQKTAKGAQSPDRRINEFDFWLKYAPYVRDAVKKAGYPCIITNRANGPMPQNSDDVIYMNKPDKNGKRYPSTYHPEHIGAGMISADYAIELKARCVVFLHLNCTTNKWMAKTPTGLIIHNKLHGRELAECVCHDMREKLLDQPGGIPNDGKGIKAIPRFIGSQPSAGWMNTLDDEKIPAIVFEALYLNNRAHVNYLLNDEKAIRLAECLGCAIVRSLQNAGLP